MYYIGAYFSSYLQVDWKKSIKIAIDDISHWSTAICGYIVIMYIIRIADLDNQTYKPLLWTRLAGIRIEALVLLAKLISALFNSSCEGNTTSLSSDAFLCSTDITKVNQMVNQFTVAINILVTYIIPNNWISCFICAKIFG